MKIYTKTGDKGTTSLFGGTRVEKSHPRIEAYGTIDELNSYIGLVRDVCNDKAIEAFLIKIQNKLFTMGAMLATPPEKAILKNGKERLNIEKVEDEDVLLLESSIDEMNKTLPEMTHFVLPGGHTTVSYCHIARCICRRCERLCVELQQETEIEPSIVMYLNRLSDFLFVLARKLTYLNNAEEIKWIPSKKK